MRCWHQQCARRGNFGGFILAVFTAHIDQQMQEIIFSLATFYAALCAVIDTVDEVGAVILFLAIERVRDAEAEIMVLHVWVAHIRPRRAIQNIFGGKLQQFLNLLEYGLPGFGADWFLSQPVVLSLVWSGSGDLPFDASR